MASTSRTDPLLESVPRHAADLFAAMNESRPSLFNPHSWQGRLIEWSMHDPQFKTNLFRFIDVLPNLETPGRIVDQLSQHLDEPDSPRFLRWSLRLASWFPIFAGPMVRQGVRRLAQDFVLEESPEKWIAHLRALENQGLSFTLDLLGETVLIESEADRYQQRYLKAIPEITHSFPASLSHQPLDKRANFSIKISALAPLLATADPGDSRNRILERLIPIAELVQKQGAFLNIDMEHYALKDLTLSVCRALGEHPKLQDGFQWGLAMQAYLKETETDLYQLLEWCRATKHRVTVRLVKGAYWDYETAVAAQKNWPCPVFETKSATDANFEKLTCFLLKNRETLIPAFGTHNIRSIAHALARAEEYGATPDEFEFQMLKGMADPIKTALTRKKYRVREYVPVGDLVPGMAYLVRRLLENTSNEGFLRSRFAHEKSITELLADPAQTSPVESKPASSGFTNHPSLDFTKSDSRASFQKGLEQVRTALGRRYFLFINGKEFFTPDYISIFNPADTSEALGEIARGRPSYVEQAALAARQASNEWSRVPVSERCKKIEAVGRELIVQRASLAAWQVLETGKNWNEADADVTEAIDFCFYYADQMRPLGQPHPTLRIPGESNVQEWISRGAGAIIAPWNFPLAILCGMTVASLVTGNTVIIKPAEQSSLVAHQFLAVLRQVGFPAGVVNMITGLGEEVGPSLVDHSAIDFVAFTGSKEVGIEIYAKAGAVHAQQKNLKKVICEMGGKNAVIADETADWDEAVTGILHSAFSFQGQKCSALSRLIVLDSAYDRLVPRLLEAAATWKVGLPEKPGTWIGPVIDQTAQHRILRVIDEAKSYARLAFQGTIPSSCLNGWFVPPTIFTDVPLNSTLHREEIFGPVLAIFRVRDLTQAIDYALDTEFALTGGFYSRSPENIDRVRREFRVGNLYINRPITGAIVGRQPFGGFKMSGTGTKAGGPEYLTHFMVPRIITENQMRHGFVPENG